MNNVPLNKLIASLNVRTIALRDSESPEQQRLAVHYASFESELKQAMTAAQIVVETPADPMDTPLPCDIVVGALTHPQGAKLSTLVARMRVIEVIAARVSSLLSIGVREFYYPLRANFEIQIAAPEAYEPPTADDWKLAIETTAKALASEPGAALCTDYIVALATYIRNFKPASKVAAPALQLAQAEPA